MAQVIDQVHRYKDCANCLIPVLFIVAGKENLWFIDALKQSVFELILPEKTLEGIKTVLENLSPYLYLRNFGTEIMAFNSALLYEKLPVNI